MRGHAKQINNCACILDKQLLDHSYLDFQFAFNCLTTLRTFIYGFDTQLRSSNRTDTLTVHKKVSCKKLVRVNLIAGEFCRNSSKSRLESVPNAKVVLPHRHLITSHLSIAAIHFPKRVWVQRYVSIVADCI